MSTRFPNPLDDREARLRSAGAEISVHPRTDNRTGTADLPEPAGFSCMVQMPDGNKFSGVGLTRDDARDEAFTATETAFGFEGEPPPPKWTIVDQEPTMLRSESDVRAWTWVLRDRAGEERRLTAGVTRTAHATIEAGGQVSLEVLEVYESRGRSLIEEHLHDEYLPPERLIVH